MLCRRRPSGARRGKGENMKRDKKKQQKLHDIIGAFCGVALIVLGVVSVVVANMPVTAGVRNSEVPDDAVTVVGKAPGRNADITVEVVMTGEKIYQITVTHHEETRGVGTEAVEKTPANIFEAQSLDIDTIGGATITSAAIKEAVMEAISAGGFDPSVFGGTRIKAEKVAAKIQPASGVTVTYAAQWEDSFPNEYASWERNSEVDELTDYLVDYPMLKTLYEPYGFSKDYKSARGHYYNLEDLLHTQRIGPNSMASCWTCKAPEFTNLVNEEGAEVYSKRFVEFKSQFTEPISCFNCHANAPGHVTVTHTYLIDAVGPDFEKIDAANLACGQCHVEYYFYPGTSATTLPYGDLDTMSPDAILAYYNDGANFPDGQPFTDYTNPRTGVKQIKVQHPELETFLGEGSRHRAKFSCADCHMGQAVSASGETYTSHLLLSPLQNEKLIASECAACHEDLTAEVKAIQAEVEERTYEIGYALEDLTEALAAAVESGEYSETQLEAIRALARDAQYYWDFVFVENSEGAHNSILTHQCLDKAEALTAEAMGMLTA